jgi:hypothetical protein
MAVPGRSLTRFLPVGGAVSKPGRSLHAHGNVTQSQQEAARYEACWRCYPVDLYWVDVRPGLNARRCSPSIGVAGTPRWARAFIGVGVIADLGCRAAGRHQKFAPGRAIPRGSSHHLPATTRAANLVGERSQSLWTGRESLRPAVVSAAVKICVTPKPVAVLTFQHPETSNTPPAPKATASRHRDRGARKEHKPCIRPQGMETS